MAKLNARRALSTSVFLLFCVGMLNLAQNVYSAIEPILTDEERGELREERYALGHCPAPSPEELEVPIEEAQTDYFDTQACVSDTSIASSIKSTNQMMAEVRSSGDTQKPHKKLEKPDSSPCSKSDKKMLAEQSRNGAHTQGLTEGKDGAETAANMPGSMAEFALISQNLQTCHEQRIKEMTQVGPSFNFYCQENPDECPETAHRWLAPIAVVNASVSRQNFSLFHAERIANADAAIAESRAVERRARQERATYERYNYLHQAFAALADKDQQIRANNEVMMMGVRGENPGEGLVEKFQSGGVSHTANSL